RWETVVLVAAALEGDGGTVVPHGSDRPDGEGQTFLSIRRGLSTSLLARLTEAERAVALLVVDGRTNAEIGRTRNASPRTIANQVSSLFRKLGVHGRCELIRSLLAMPRESAPESASFPRRSAPESDLPVLMG